MVEEARTGAVARAGGVRVGGIIGVGMVRVVGVVRVVAGGGELAGALAGVMEGAEGDAVAHVGTGVVGGGRGGVVVGGFQGGVVVGGEGFERLVEAFLVQSGGAGEEHTGAGPGQPGGGPSGQISLPGGSALVLQRTRLHGWRRFTQRSHFILQT